MPTKYQALYHQALAAYKAQSPRFGYPRGYFSWARHWSLKETAEMQTLSEALSGDDEAAAKKALEAFLPGKNQDNHSFATYLLDELEKAYPTEGWGEHRLASKKIVFYTGMVYRGIKTSDPEKLAKKFFDEGITEFGTPSEYVSGYTSDTSMSCGISTSKDKLGAQRYAGGKQVIRNTARTMYVPGMLIEINYRGASGIDIIETLKARGSAVTLATTMATTKQEVNIIGHIPREDIVAITLNPNKKESIRLENDRYEPDREVELSSAGTAERLASAMKAPGS